MEKSSLQVDYYYYSWNAWPFDVDVSRFVWNISLISKSFVLILCSGIVHIIIVVLGRASFLGIVPGLQRALAVIQPTYRVTAPTFPIESITQDVVPIPCHSHNDYWRAVPLFDALHAGCTSVEADLWLLPGDHEIYVGHDRGSLSDRRTLRGMYLNPIHDLLRRSYVYLIDKEEDARHESRA